MPEPEGERLARLEAIASDVRADIADLKREELRTRGRLHDVEKVTEGLLTLQRELHRENDDRLRRMALAIQRGGLVMAAAMFTLALVTLLLHH